MLNVSSGVARVPCAKNIFAPPPTNTAKFKIKRGKSAEEVKAEHLLCCFCCCFSTLEMS